MAMGFRSFLRLIKFIIVVLVLWCFSCVLLWMYMTAGKSQIIVGKLCKIKKLNPWDKSLKPFLDPPKPLICSKREQIMYVNTTGHLMFNKTVTNMYQIDTDQLNCAYGKLDRENGDKEVTFGPEVKLTLPVFMKSHVFRVTCLSSSSYVVYDYLLFNPFYDSDPKRYNEIDIENEDKLSVIIFGIDSVSRSHAMRNLPKSYKYILEKFDAYDFEGYSKVGENTWPNLVPLLTGRSHRSFPLETHSHTHVDNMTLIWNEKSMKHFMTCFAEDRPDISTFNFSKRGFWYQPTDFYFRPYTLGMHKFDPIIIRRLGKPSRDCYGINNYFDIQIDYLKGFLSHSQGKRKFVYFWNNQLCHDSFATLSRGDDSFLKFLQWLQHHNHTQNAILIVLSDHGFRLGGASLTEIGRAENNKPWLMIHVPKFLKAKYPWLHGNLLQNSKRLTTHYDTYQTILDLIQGRAFNKNCQESVGKSLVRRNLFCPIPVLRTCEDAGIEEQYCSCDEKTYISAKSEIVQKVATFLVQGINDILSKNQDVCRTLHLHSVTEAYVSYTNSDESNLPNELKKEQNKYSFFSRFLRKSDTEPDLTGRYYILFHTSPGHAYFEGTADYANYSDMGGANYITMIGEPSRLDKYGNQSACVQDSFLRLFCYCKGNVEK